METNKLEKIQEILKDMSLEDLIELKENPECFGLEEIIDLKEEEVSTEDSLKKLKVGDCFICNDTNYFRNNYLNQTSFSVFKVVTVGIPNLDSEVITGSFIYVDREVSDDIAVFKRTWDISRQDLKDYFRKIPKKVFKKCDQIYKDLNKDVEDAYLKAATNIQITLGL